MKNLRKLFLSIFGVLLLLSLFLGGAKPVQGATYKFTLTSYEVEAYIQTDGNVTLYYYMEFLNDPSADAIDFVDLGLPYGNYALNKIEATINGQPMPEVNNSAYVHGAELALKNLAIKPGEKGVVTAWVRDISGLLNKYDGSDRENYANFQISPNYFNGSFDYSTATKYRMTIVLPNGVKTDEGVYYRPENWPGSADPQEASTTKQEGRVYYSWYAENADTHSQYTFGCAFPASTIPAEALAVVPPSTNSGNGSSSGSSSSFNSDSIYGCTICGLVLAVFIFVVVARIIGNKQMAKRKMQYLSPKISVDGKGIKRGLTAVEAGILLEEPLDKIFTMILFGLLKKEAVSVVKKEPLQIQASDPLPEGLYPYETAFIEAMQNPKTKEQRKDLQTMLIALVKDLTEKMKGFSKKETCDYYRSIIARAWQAVENANTPEIKSAQYDHTLEWTMMDEDFNQRTQRSFANDIVFLPAWWARYNPIGLGARPVPTSGLGGLASPIGSSSSSSSGSGMGSSGFSRPHLPGSDFAASIINGSSAMAAGVLGNLNDFTSGVTNRTNPLPPSVSSSSGSGGFRGGGGGGSSCACACACAGCACACAGGGR